LSLLAQLELERVLNPTPFLGKKFSKLVHLCSLAHKKQKSKYLQ
jgi:hypothetical protein